MRDCSENSTGSAAAPTLRFADRLTPRQAPIRDHAGVDGTPILICYDGSGDAARGIEAAAALLGARRAVVLNVVLPLTGAESVAAVSPVVPAAAFEQVNTDDADTVAARGAELARAAGFEAEARVVLETPTWQGVVDAADEVNAAMIVIGSRGLDQLHEVFEGSLSHQVAAHAGRPVLIVPPPHDER
jgi:nucleotide-binding universal stress UspA family protein